MGKKKLSKVEFRERICDWLIEKWRKNFEEKGFKGLGLLYSGIIPGIKRKYEELFETIETKELVDFLNVVLKDKGFVITGDKKAKLKLVRLSEGESVKREVIEELDKVLG